MICPGSIRSTLLTAPKTFTNWARALTFTAAKAFRPSTRGEIVEIIRQAEEAGQRVKWTGSLWSFMGNFVSTAVEVQSDLITGVIPGTLILDRLTLADPSLGGNLVHIKGGTKVYNVNRILQGLSELPPGTTGDHPGETDLPCAGAGLLTLGGSGGQSIAGVMATGSHGGDVHLPPIADAVMAIHLIGPGGQEWWIERTAGLTAGSEADVQRQLQTIAETVPGAAAEMCNGILVKKNDDFFRAVLVSVGRMGFVYSLVVKTRPAYKLQETRVAAVWERFKPANLTPAAAFDAFVESPLRYLQILINPFPNGDGQHDIKVATRVEVTCPTHNSPPTSGFDPMGLFCGQQDVRIALVILIPLLAILLATEAGLVALLSAELAAASALAAIPFVGWVLAAALYAVAAVTAAAIAALAAAIAALTALIAYLTLAGSLTPGELIARIANFAYGFGFKDVMKALLIALYNAVYTLDGSTGVSWKIMDTYGYAGENFCQKVDSMEIAFDVANADGGYLAFIDEVFAIFDDLFNRNIAVAGIMALRYTARTTALIGMSKFPTTCHIEIPLLRDFQGNAEFIERVQRSAIAHNGVPHWGQLMGTYTAADTGRLHGGDLTTWRRRLTDLIRGGGGGRFTFSNDFTMTYNLEPFDDTPISAVRLTVTVGDDALGDTDIFRHDVSADFARVTLHDGTFFEVSLNEGTEWSQHTTHVRDVPVASGNMWGDVASVLIRHQAAGNDWNADNWTMNAIVIASVSTLSVVTDQFSQTATPIWQFRKNDHQIWQHDFL